MPKPTILRGIAWDHPRGYEPLMATSKTFERENPDLNITIDWDIRSLKEFGDMPIEELIDAYDLITIDHPYMGQAFANKLLLPLEDKFPKRVFEKLSRQSVGPSFQSYYYKTHLFALPIDAAALVAASRMDLIEQLGVQIPTKRSDLFDFYKKIPDSYSVAWALCPTDVWCAFLTLCAQEGSHNFIKNYEIDSGIAIAVLDEIKLHLQYLHPESLNWNPIQILDKMSDQDDVIYAPFLFGYTNYAREGYKKNIIHFDNSPANPKNNVSTILGGVGLAISSKCKHEALALAYLNYVSKAETQTGIFTESGGQPGNLVAWKNEDNNKLCNNFFKNTLKTMNEAYVRPQHKNWNEFQEQGADIIHDGLVTNKSSSRIVKTLNTLYKTFS